MSAKIPTPHFFKIIARKSTYTMPGICVNCSAPSVKGEAIKVTQFNTDNKVKTTQEPYFPLCADCGMVVKNFHKSDPISMIVASRVAFLPAALYLVLQILALATFATTVLPPLIIFGLFYYVLVFLLKPLDRFFIKNQYRKKFSEIRKSCKSLPSIKLP